jgi:hypothetical protein
MALLRVILPELFARLTDLLDHEILVVSLYDLLEGALFVSGKDNKAESLLNDSLVLLWRNRKLLHAGCVAAFTVERERRFDAVPFGPFVYPLVDRPKNFFVSRGSFREVHPAMIARLRVDRPFNAAVTPMPGEAKGMPPREVKRSTKEDDLRREIEEAIARAAAGKRRKLDDTVKPSPPAKPRKADGPKPGNSSK